ncbi:MAG: hypothetical protein RLZZ200_1797 [Pseudomonadota bacterium]
MTRRKPLRLLIPAVLFVFGLFVTGLGAYAEIHSRNDRLVSEISARAASLGNRVVSTLEYALARDDLDSSRLQVALLVGEPGLELALLSDERGQVVQSTRGEHNVRPLAESLGDGSRSLVEAARKSERAQYRMSPDGADFEAAFPVHMHLRPGELRSTRVGALYLAFDLTDAHATSEAEAFREAGWFAGGIMLLCLLSALYLRHVVSRRVAVLQDAVRRIAGGDWQVRANLGGDDELTDLAEGVNRMAGTLDARESELQRANADLRLSEARFRQVVENIHEVFWVSDVEVGHLTYVSPACEQIWGVSPDELSASPDAWLDYIVPEDRPRVEAAYAALKVTGRYDETFRVRIPKGLRWIRDRGFLVVDEAGRSLNIVGVAEDITDRQDLEARYHQAQKLEAVGRLAGGIAHDFNNLLTAILGNVRLALEDLEPAHPAVESLREIQRAGERARALVQQILVFNRGLPQQKQVVAMAPLVREAAAQAKASLPSGARVDVRAADDLPHVLGHATRLHQVVLNLLTNAGHALDGRPGTVEVDLSVVRIDQEMLRLHPGMSEGQAVCLRVRDSGRGMDAATRGRIFEPFFTTREVGQGSGLGLSLAYAIVKEHDGAIDVYSVLGKGSTFTVYLPVTRQVLPAPEPGPSATETGRGERIVYLDDDDALISLISRSLQRLGYQVTSFTEQEAALRFFQANPSATDIFITDFNMPGLTGLDVARRVREIRADMPVLLVSGYVTDELVGEARKLGVRQVLEKPDGIAALTRAIDTALRS